jgi:hypothetical protein
VFFDDLVVELHARSAGAKIRYTLDGSEPTTESRGYSGPITVDRTTLLKAAAFESGLTPSETVAETYTMLDRGLKGFSSNLPLVIINTFGQMVTKERPITASLRVIGSDQRRSTLTGTNAFDGHCELKLHGFSSLRAPKRSLTVKLRETDGQHAPASILGMPKDSDWVLYAPYSDKTMIRDVLAYELSNQMGRYAARTRFVELFLNRSGDRVGARDYVGVYVLEEKIRRGKDRVNVQKLKPEDDSEPNVTGGYIIKRDHATSPMDMPFGFFSQGRMPPSSSSEESGFTTGRGLHLFYVYPKEKEITAAQKAYLTRYMTQFERALYGPNFRSLDDGYAKYLDVDSFIDQFWIVELSKNVDGFRYSCYMSKDRGGKLRLEPIWDWNLSFGNANYHQGWTPEEWYWRLLRESEVSWIKRLSQDPEFIQRLTDRWADLRKGVFAPKNILGKVDQFAAQLAEAQVRNFRRWPILGQSINPNWYVGDSYQDEVEWMKNWIQERIAWIDHQFVSTPAIADKQSAGSTGVKLKLEAADGDIYYTLDGSDPRLPGGGISPKAQGYSDPIRLGSRAQLVARVRSGDRWSGRIRFPSDSP